MLRKLGITLRKDEGANLAGKVSLIGERNSGTNFVFFKILKPCFGSTINPVPYASRHKHWFQYDDHGKHMRIQYTNGEKPDTTTFVIAMFRNVYDWSAAMFNTPYHMPYHNRYVHNLTFEEFANRPWTMKDNERSITDLKNWDCIRCCQGGFFNYTEVNPCNPSPEEGDNGALYELNYRDKSGHPYKSILEMRADKIRNFALDVQDYDWVHSVFIIQYEDLAEGFNGKANILKLVEEIERRTGVTRTCNDSVLALASESGDARKWVKTDQDTTKDTIPEPDKGNQYDIFDRFFPQSVSGAKYKDVKTEEFMAFIDQNADWAAEALVGYHCRLECRVKELFARSSIVLVAITFLLALQFSRTKFCRRQRNKSCRHVPGWSRSSFIERQIVLKDHISLNKDS